MVWLNGQLGARGDFSDTPSTFAQFSFKGCKIRRVVFINLHRDQFWDGQLAKVNPLPNQAPNGSWPHRRPRSPVPHRQTVRHCVTFLRIITAGRSEWSPHAQFCSDCQPSCVSLTEPRPVSAGKKNM
jgi:hypothetical protein